VTHEFARKLRREQTEVERKLRYPLRDRAFTESNFAGSSPLDPTSSISSASKQSSSSSSMEASTHFRRMRRRNGYERHFLRGRGFAVFPHPRLNRIHRPYLHASPTRGEGKRSLALTRENQRGECPLPLWERG